ncbi:MAG: hypothetical protein AB1798_08840, partial [Spirochaetota bacterium]
LDMKAEVFGRVKNVFSSIGDYVKRAILITSAAALLGAMTVSCKPFEKIKLITLRSTGSRLAAAPSKLLH